MLCERCGRGTGAHTMSIFNTDDCCMECIKEERKHPDFPRAREVELDELLKGNYNFPGIGLPEDLKNRR